MRPDLRPRPLTSVPAPTSVPTDLRPRPRPPSPGRLYTLVVFLAISTLAGQELPPSTPDSFGLSSARLREATGLLNQFVTDQKIAGAVAAVSRKGKVVYLEAVGVQDLETRAPMAERSLFRIYSMTKPITAVAAMMLHDEGRFRLEESGHEIPARVRPGDGSELARRNTASARACDLD